MVSRLTVGIMGAGSIGCYLGGRLALSGQVDVLLIGRSRMGREIAASGLHLRDYGKDSETVPADRLRFSEDPEQLATASIVLCCVKSAQTEEVAQRMAGALAKDAIVVSMQNGVGNAAALRKHLGDRRVLAGIVDFNVVAQGEGRFQRTTSGPLSVETCADARWQEAVSGFRESGLAVAEHDDIVPFQWTKLLINLNNAISALSGAPTRQLIVDASYRRIVAAVVGEGIAVLRKAGIRPARLRGVPVAWMPKVLSLPSPIVRLVTRAQMKIDPEARSSMWQDLQAHRRTEVDYLNGEIVSLAERVGAAAPINRAVVGLIRKAEADDQGSPGLSGAELWTALSR